MLLSIQENEQLKPERFIENPYGQTSKLQLITGIKNGKTILKHLFFTAPFKIISPFYDEYETIKVMLLSVSAGIMEGDVQEIKVIVSKDTKMELSSQSYEKIHKMKHGCAIRKTEIYVESHAFLNYNPLPVIPYKDSSFENRLDVELQDGTSAFQMCEILTCGRSACKERFEYHYYHSIVHVRKKGILVYRDNTRFNPKQTEMNGTGMYEGYTHLAMLLLYNMNKKEGWIVKVRKLLDSYQNIEGGATCIQDEGYLVRILGNNAQELQKICQRISYIK